jgi:large subunit ribosomal protein L6
MSRIGKLPVAIPPNVKVDWQEPVLTVSKGSLSLTRRVHPNISLSLSGPAITFTPRDLSQANRALWGLTRTLVSNMVLGVSDGFTKVLEVVGVGWRAEVQDNKEIKGGQILKLTLGYSHPIDFALPAAVKAAVDPKSYRITLTSPDKELLGLTAAKIRSWRRPEPYKGKGIRYLGESIRRKVGKTGGK